MGKICVDKGINRPVDAPFLFVHNRIYKLDFPLVRVSTNFYFKFILGNIGSKFIIQFARAFVQLSQDYSSSINFYIFCSVVLLAVQHWIWTTLVICSFTRRAMESFAIVTKFQNQPLH